MPAGMLSSPVKPLCGSARICALMFRCNCMAAGRYGSALFHCRGTKLKIRTNATRRSKKCSDVTIRLQEDMDLLFSTVGVQSSKSAQTPPELKKQKNLRGWDFCDIIEGRRRRMPPLPHTEDKNETLNPIRHARTVRADRRFCRLRDIGRLLAPRRTASKLGGLQAAGKAVSCSIQ